MTIRVIKELETITPQQICRLPVNKDFLPSHKQNRTAFTAFCLSFFKTLKQLTKSEKRKYVQRQLSIRDGLYNNIDNYSDDENLIDIKEEYDLMFPDSKRKYNGLI